MGTKAVDALEISFEDMPMYLRAKHSVYMDVNGASYYLTDVNDRYWRAQDTSQKNEKGHYVDCSELVRDILRIGKARRRVKGEGHFNNQIAKP